MLLNHYLRIGWRNLIKHKMVGAINIFGLAVGLAAVVLIALFVQYELSYDSFWAKADRIFRVQMSSTSPGMPRIELEFSSPLLKQALEQDFPEIQRAVRTFGVQVNIESEDVVWTSQITEVDPSILELFELTAVSGNLSAALQDRQSLVLNQSMARKFFPDQDPIGQSLRINSRGAIEELKVAAVIADLPPNSWLNLSLLRKFDELQVDNSWMNLSTTTYFLLRPNAKIESVNARLVAFVDSHFPKHRSAVAEAKASDGISLSTLNLRDLRFYTARIDDQIVGRRGISRSLIWGFAAVAALILSIACMNVMNLNTALARQRAQEISLRKVVGAKRGQLIVQFLGESIALSLISLIIAISLTEMMLPGLSTLIGRPLSLSYTANSFFGMVALASIVGVISGLYPAFILSAYRPVNALKTKQSHPNNTSFRFQQGLVVTQFAVAIGLLVVTGVIYIQVGHINSRELGVNTQNVLMIDRINGSNTDSHRKSLITELSRHHQVEKLSGVDFNFGTLNMSSARTQSMPNEIVISVRQVGYGYFEIYQIPFLFGGPFEKRVTNPGAFRGIYQSGNSDRNSIIITQSAANQLGIAMDQDSLGQEIFTNTATTEMTGYELIGIIPDVLLMGPEAEAKPTLFLFSDSPEHVRSIHIRYRGDAASLIKDIEALGRSMGAGSLSISFVQDIFEAQHQMEIQQANVFSAFAGLTILIANLGLYALASLTSQRRTKEIGIRKALGAKVTDIVKLMLWQFSKPVLLANLIAWPVAYYFMSDWLDGFAYRIGKEQILLFCLLSGLLALLIAWGTVASNAIRAARARPVKALRYE